MKDATALDRAPSFRETVEKRENVRGNREKVEPHIKRPTTLGFCQQLAVAAREKAVRDSEQQKTI